MKTVRSALPDEIMERRLFTSKDGTPLPYRIYIPEDYDCGKSYPLVLFLHGAGERGTDNSLHLTRIANVCDLILSDIEKYGDCVIIAPQCPVTAQWVDTPWEKGGYSVKEVKKSVYMRAAEELLAATISDYSIDKKRIYVSGLSMGGFATWDVVMRNPELFAAAVPVCGGADPETAESIKNVPIWTIHSTGDLLVPFSGTEDMVLALEKVGGDIRFTLTDLYGHSAWLGIYDTTEVIDWIFSKKRTADGRFSEE